MVLGLQFYVSRVTIHQFREMTSIISVIILTFHLTIIYHILCFAKINAEAKNIKYTNTCDFPHFVFPINIKIFNLQTFLEYCEIIIIKVSLAATFSIIIIIYLLSLRLNLKKTQLKRATYKYTHIYVYTCIYTYRHNKIHPFFHCQFKCKSLYILLVLITKEEMKLAVH